MAGIALETVASGAAAEVALAGGSYRLAVLDEHMAPGSGLEVAAARRAAGDTTPLVLWTADPRAVATATTEALGLHVAPKNDVQELVALVERLRPPAADDDR